MSLAHPVSSPARLALLVALTPLSALTACPDPCDAPCGEACCAHGSVCDPAQNACVDCVPQCADRQCGDDGCGQTCGSCEGELACDPGGLCVAPTDAGRPDAGSGPDAGHTGPAVTFKVMDWNVHDLFDTVDDPAKSDVVLSSTALTKKLGALAAVINAQAPDLLTVQEVETKDLLRRLNDGLSSKLPYYELIPAVNNDPRGINVGLLSRFPLAQAVSHQNDVFWGVDGNKYYYSRDCLEVHLDLGGGRKLVVLVNHLVSQLEDSNEYKRQAQAQHTREIADALRGASPDTAVLITGDMNDVPTSPTLAKLLDGGSWIDLWAGTTASQAWTYKESSTKLYRLDYLLPDSTTASWRTSATIVHGTDVTAASDHEPVVATFLYP